MRVLCLLILLFPKLLFSHEADCTVYFSHNEQLAERLIGLIDKEEKSIKMAVFCLTHVGIAKALIRARDRGAQIEVLVDPFSIKTRSSIQRLFEANIPLYVWDQQMVLSPRRGRAKMHDNFCILGEKSVWTGSFTPTMHASKRNQDNVVVIESKEVAMQYLDEFSHLKNYQARPFQEYLSLHPKKERAKKSSARYANALMTKVKK